MDTVSVLRRRAVASRLGRRSCVNPFQRSGNNSPRFRHEHLEQLKGERAVLQIGQFCEGNLHYFEPQIDRNLTEMNYVVTLWKITLRSIDRFSILMAQNDRQVTSFRLRRRSTSGLCEKFLPQQKPSRGRIVTFHPRVRSSARSLFNIVFTNTRPPTD